MPEIQTDPDVYVLYDRQFIRTPAGRGEALRLHLASHGIPSKGTRLAPARFLMTRLGRGEMFKLRAVLLAVPLGKMARGTPHSAMAQAVRPTVPSPPATRTTSQRSVASVAVRLLGLLTTATSSCPACWIIFDNCSSV